MSRKKKIDTKHLFHGINTLNVIPVFSKSSVEETMVTQMLFGECCTVLEKKNKFWCKVKIEADQMVGWVQTIQLKFISESEYDKYIKSYAIAIEICHPVFNDDISKTIVLGSTLPMYDGMSLTLPDGKYIYNGQALLHSGIEFSIEMLSKISKRYLHSPELKGGRSPFGIDASGFVQLVFRFFGYQLPRTAHEQSIQGVIVDFIEQMQEGDLAFCQDDEGLINHVGIIIGEKKIIHVNGCVRIDKIDHHGIYHHELCKYTHKVRIIKRILE